MISIAVRLKAGDGSLIIIDVQPGGSCPGHDCHVNSCAVRPIFFAESPDTTSVLLRCVSATRRCTIVTRFIFLWSNLFSSDGHHGMMRLDERLVCSICESV